MITRNPGPSRRSFKTLALSAALTAGLMAPVSLPVSLAAPADSPSAAQQACRDIKISNSTMQWGFKASFMRYLKGPIAKGSVSTTGGVSETGGILSFAQGQGQYNFTTHGVEIAYPGSFAFYGHDGALDMAFSNVRLVTEYENRTMTAFFVADVEFKEFKGFDATDAPVQRKADVKFATVDTSAMGRNPIAFNQAAVTLTEAGAEAMGGFYEAGEVLDTLTLTSEMGAMGSACPEEPAPVEPEDPEVPEQPTKPVEPADPEKPHPAEPTPSTPSKPIPQPSKPAPKPSPSVTKPATPKSAEVGISSGTFTWGLKDSFVKYINGPIAKGKITVTGGSHKDGILTFKKAKGAFDTKSQKGHISFDGKVNYRGHGGLLDTTLNNFTLKLNGSKTATLLADVEAKNLDGSKYSGKQIGFATVNVSNAKLSKNSVSLTNAPTTLTKTGAEAFGGFYDAGADLAPLSVNANFSAATKPAAPAKSEKAKTTGGKTTATKPAGTQRPVAPVAGKTSTTSSTQPGASVAGEPQKMVEVCTDNELVNGTASWGVKSSFTSYLRGAIANGDWSLNGVTHSNGTFNYANGTGSFDKKAGTGVLSLPGFVHFKGHSGALDMKLSNMKIQITGTNSAKMILDVSSKAYGGQGGVNSTGIEFATITGPISVSGDKVSASGASVTLTKTGAEAFAGFYQAGQAMDPISFSASIGEGGGCSMVPADSAAAAAGKSELARTGASAAPLAATGFGALLLGAATIFAARRNKKEIGG